MSQALMNVVDDMALVVVIICSITRINNLPPCWKMLSVCLKCAFLCTVRIVAWALVAAGCLWVLLAHWIGGSYTGLDANWWVASSHWGFAILSMYAVKYNTDRRLCKVPMYTPDRRKRLETQ